MPKANETDEVVVVEQTPAEALASQKEGFSEAGSSTSLPAPTEKSAEQIQADADAVKQEAEKVALAAEQAVTAEAARVAAEAASKQPGITQEQLDAYVKTAIRSHFDKVNGKVGSIEQTLKELQANKSAGVQLTEEDVADLKTEYGDELAGALLKTLNKFGAKIGAGKPLTAEEKAAAELKAADELRAAEQAKIDDAVKASKTEAEKLLITTKQELELKMLNITHKGWRKLIQVADATGKFTGYTPDFATWLALQPKADQDKLQNAWDADFLSDKIGEFKDHLKTKAAEAEAKGKKTSTPGRLAAAVPAKSSPGSPTPSQKTALQEQQEGYASV
jgi:hypothetical protein